MSLMLRKEEALRDIWWHLHKNKLVHKPQAIEKVITRANHPPTPHFPPPREREVNPPQGHQKQLAFRIH